MPASALRLLLVAVLALVLTTACDTGSLAATPTARASASAVRTSIPGASSTARPLPSTSPTSTPLAARTPTSTPTAPATPPPTAPEAKRVILLGEPATLRPTIEVEVGGTSSTLIFEGIDKDSRCPADVVCVQAGSVTAIFDAWDGRATHRGAVTLPSTGPATVTLGPIEVTLLNVEPTPLAGRKLEPFDYRAVVRVTRLVASGTPGGTSGAGANSGIDGAVTLGPNCPVARADQPCPDRPYEATLVVKTALGQTVTTTRSDARGKFSLDLPPGKYVIEPQLVGSARLPFAAPVDVTVPPIGRAAVTIAYDTGIR